jgi:hypothetical protein
MKNKFSHLLVSYCSSVLADKGRRDQCYHDDEIIKDLIPYVFVLNFSPPFQATYYLAGTSVQRAMGVNLKGRSFYDFWSATAHPVLAARLMISRETRSPICITSKGFFSDSLEVEFETIMIPVYGADAAQETFIGISMAADPQFTEIASLVGVQRIEKIEFASGGYGQRERPMLRLVS